METLKRITVTLLMLGTIACFNAQNQTEWQNAFHKSYEAEIAGRYPQAIAELRRVFKANDYFMNIRLGWLHYLSKDYTESIRHYQAAIRLKPYSIEAKFGIIKPLSAIENWDQVRNQYQAILKIDPQNTVANYWLGVIHYNRKEFNAAVKLFEKVVNLYPLDYDSVIMLGWTKLNLGNTAEARILFHHALTLRANDKSALEGLKLIK